MCMGGIISGKELLLERDPIFALNLLIYILECRFRGLACNSGHALEEVGLLLGASADDHIFYTYFTSHAESESRIDNENVNGRMITRR